MIFRNYIIHISSAAKFQESEYFGKNNEIGFA